VIAKKTCRMIRVIDLVRKIKETWSRGSDISEQQIIDQFASVDLLVLDEVGIQFGTDTEKLFMFDVIDLRYQRNLPTVLISNLAVEDIANAVGSRVVDRLRENGGKYIAMKWDSKRK
jgi:DNA replication protein DnaC